MSGLERFLKNANGPPKKSFKPSKKKAYSKGSKMSAAMMDSLKYMMPLAADQRYVRAARNKKAAVAKQLMRNSFSECGRKYLTAAVSPFSADAVGACTPIVPSRPSLKVTARTYGTFVGSGAGGGPGFLIVTPCIANDDVVAIGTNSGYAGGNNVIVTGANATQRINFEAGDLPYTRAQLLSGTADAPPSVRGRIVSVGVRVRYTGSQLNLQGSILAFVSPTHANLNKQSFSEIAQRNGCFRGPISRDWTEVSTIAIDQEELEYVRSNQSTVKTLYPFSNHQQLEATDYRNNGGAPIVFCVTGGTEAPYEFEIVQHIEYTGEAVVAQATPNGIDAGAVEHSQSVLQDVNGHRTERTPREEVHAAGKSRAGYVLPGHKYLGPGNPLDGSVPSSQLDNLAMIHDIAYDNALHTSSTASDVRRADDKFISEAISLGTPLSLAAAAAITAKRSVETFVPLYP